MLILKTRQQQFPVEPQQRRRNIGRDVCITAAAANTAATGVVGAGESSVTLSVEQGGWRGFHVVPVAERIHGLGRYAKVCDLGLDDTVPEVALVDLELDRCEPTDAGEQQLEREHDRGHRKPAHHHRVRGVQVRVAELPLLAAQVQWTDDRLRQIFSLQVFYDTRLHVRRHSAWHIIQGDQIWESIDFSYFFLILDNLRNSQL